MLHINACHSVIIEKIFIFLPTSYTYTEFIIFSSLHYTVGIVNIQRAYFTRYYCVGLTRSGIIKRLYRSISKYYDIQFLYKNNPDLAYINCSINNYYRLFCVKFCYKNYVNILIFYSITIYIVKIIIINNESKSQFISDLYRPSVQS